MKGKVFILVLALVAAVFFHFYNASLIVHNTQRLSEMEKRYQAERNINTELKISHDDLISARNISQVIPEDMKKRDPNKDAGNLVYIQEPPAQPKTPAYYAIIDLLTPKAEAVTAVQPD